MVSEHPSPAHADKPQGNHPRRIWDEERQVWVGAMTVCRNVIGRFASKDGTEPDSQLVFTFCASDLAAVTKP